MIPDGCSTALLSSTRLYQQYYNMEQSHLAIDPFLCGMVLTHSSDAPIGDSAPTSSCYVTGQPSQTGFISTYPQKTNHDLFPIDANKAFQPLATILEAARILKHKATGLVFTCEFPQATPADCATHSYSRKNYSSIARQMVNNQVDIVIGGGVKYLSDNMVDELQQRHYQVFRNDYAGMRACSSDKMWALFGTTTMQFDLDRDTTAEPSLAEMTAKAISSLSKRPEGFFLMVEGSLIDPAAHNNDIKTAITEFLSFNNAVEVAMDFARQDGQTVVLILPDHGCGGINIGNRKSNHGYDKLSLEQIIKPVDKFLISTSKMADLIKNEQPENLAPLFQKYYDVQLSASQLEAICNASNYHASPIERKSRKGPNLTRTIAQLLYDSTYFSTTTYGHTGEDVFLACYHPQNDIPLGAITNIEVNQYLCKQLGIDGQLPQLTEEIFTPHQTLFNDAQSITIDSLGNEQYRLTVKYKKHTLIAESDANYLFIDKQRIDLESVIVYMKKNDTFYLPKKVKNEK